VFEVALAGYRTGRTPNPDILCNREIKFHQFLEYALSRGADRIATGHYARVGMQGAHFRLLKACDQQKDQTYFLYTLGQRELGRTLFPIGGLTKLQVRQLALQAGFPNHAKKDSTGICFVGERKFKEFLGRYIAREPGAIVTQQGEQIGCHDGLMFYTLGQRHGLRLGGRSGGSGEPWYVVGKDLGENRLVVAQGRNHPALLGRRLLAEHLFWVDDAPPAFPFRCQAKTRYRQQEQEAILEPAGDSNEGCCVVRFEMPQRAMTPGQSVVFYLGDECVGGGTIAAVVDEADLNNGESQIWRRLPR
jgi:tRNA-specific 2-thiouridylase